MEKKTKVRLLALQIGSVIADRDSNIKKVKELLESTLAQRKVDFVFLPEVWTVGWDCESFASIYENFSNSFAITMLKSLAKKYSVNIIGGSVIEKNQNGILTNTAPIINRKGELVAKYDKMHLYSYYGSDEGRYIKAGENPILVELDGIKIGISICYDIRFPELYRAYRKAGADILVNMAAWGASKKIPWDSMTTARAVENQTYFIALTQTGDLADGTRNLGHSMIIDYKGNVLDEIDLVEGPIYAEIDLESMYEFRNKCTVLDDIQESYEVIKK